MATLRLRKPLTRLVYLCSGILIQSSNSIPNFPNSNGLDLLARVAESTRQGDRSQTLNFFPEYPHESLGHQHRCADRHPLENNQSLLGGGWEQGGHTSEANSSRGDHSLSIGYHLFHIFLLTPVSAPLFFKQKKLFSMTSITYLLYCLKADPPRPMKRIRLEESPGGFRDDTIGGNDRRDFSDTSAGTYFSMHSHPVEPIIEMEKRPAQITRHDGTLLTFFPTETTNENVRQTSPASRANDSRISLSLWAQDGTNHRPLRDFYSFRTLSDEKALSQSLAETGTRRLSPIGSPVRAVDLNKPLISQFKESGDHGSSPETSRLHSKDGQKPSAELNLSHCYSRSGDLDNTHPHDQNALEFNGKETKRKAEYALTNYENIQQIKKKGKITNQDHELSSSPHKSTEPKCHMRDDSHEFQRLEKIGQNLGSQNEQSQQNLEKSFDGSSDDGIRPDSKNTMTKPDPVEELFKLQYLKNYTEELTAMEKLNLEPILHDSCRASSSRGITPLQTTFDQEFENLKMPIDSTNWLDMKELKKEKVKHKKNVQRYFPTNLLSTYMDKLDSEIAKLHWWNKHCPRHLVRENSDSPISVYRYKYFNENNIATCIDMVLVKELKGIAGRIPKTIKKVMLIHSFRILISSVIYHHMCIFKLFQVHQSKASEFINMLIDWILSEIFHPTNGNPIFGQIMNYDGIQDVKLSRSQKIIIRFISNSTYEKESSYVAVWILGFWYKNTVPDLWSKIFKDDQSFWNTMDQMIEQDSGDKILSKNLDVSVFQRKKYFVESNRLGYDEFPIIKSLGNSSLLFQPSVRLLILNPNLLNLKIHGLHQQNPILEKEKIIKDKIQAFYNDFKTNGSYRDSERSPVFQLKKFTWKSQDCKSFQCAIMIQNNSMNCSQKPVLILKKIQAIFSGTSYLHSKLSNVIPKSLNFNYQASHLIFLDWISDIIFLNNEGGVPIFKIQSHPIKSNFKGKLIFSFMQRYILKALTRELDTASMYQVGAYIFGYWLKEEFQSFWEFLEDGKFWNFVDESFFEISRLQKKN